jgi:putative heme-binding domain-containing protein
MRTLAGGGKSPRVRLAIASALQRLSPEDRWPLAKALASRGEDSQDQNLPLMVWYGIEPLIDNDLELYAQLACSAAIPRVRENMARRIASSRNAAEGLELLAKNVAGAADLSMQTDVLSGVLLGLEGLRHVPMPKTWPGAYARIHEQGDTATRRNAIRLALIFRDQDAIKSLRKLALDSRGEAEHRSSAIDALVDSKIDRFGDSLLRLLDDADVRRSVLRGLSWYNAPNTAGQIVARYGAFSSEERQLALQTLSTRVAWGRVVMEAMRQNKSPAGDVTALTARQLQSLGDESISAQLKETWGEVRSTEKTRAKQIASLEKTLTQDVIAKADMARGAALYKQHCANCHRFFGEGGKIGPDITGAQRNNVRYLLDNIVDPSASVSQDYRMQVIVTEDGQVISGLVEDESERTVTVVNTTDRIIISRNEIESQTQSAVSIMPTGLLERLNDREIRDLIGYLQR